MDAKFAALEKLILEKNSFEDATGLKNQLEEKERIIKNLNNRIVDLETEVHKEKCRNSILKDDRKDMSEEIVQLRIKLNETTVCVHEQNKVVVKCKAKLENVENIIRNQEENFKSLSNLVRNESTSTSKHLVELFSQKSETFTSDVKELKSSITSDANSDRLKLADDFAKRTKELESNFTITNEKLLEANKSFEKEAKNVISNHLKQCHEANMKSLDEKKEEVDARLDDKLFDLESGFQKVSEDSQEVFSTIDKLQSEVLATKESQNQLKNMKLCKELGQWYHELKKCEPHDVESHGKLLQNVIIQGYGSRFNSEQFCILLDLLPLGTLEWQNPSNENRNSIELAWSLGESHCRDMAAILVSACSSEFVKQCKQPEVKPSKSPFSFGSKRSEPSPPDFMLQYKPEKPIKPTFSFERK